MNPTVVDADVIVVGAGLAGLSAYCSASARCRPLLLSQDDLGDGSSSFASARNLLAARLFDAPVTAEERSRFIDEAMALSGGRADERLVRGIAEQAHGRLRWLLSREVDFEAEGRALRRVRGCFSSEPRCFVIRNLSDLRRCLVRAASARGLRVLRATVAARLLVRDGAVTGVDAVGPEGERIVVRAAACILAAGGGAGLYAQTLVPPDLVGASAVLAREAGAEPANLRFMEFFLAEEGAGGPKALRKSLAGMASIRNRAGRDAAAGLFASAEDFAEARLRRAEHFAFTKKDGSGRIDQAVGRAMQGGGCVLELPRGFVPAAVYARAFLGGVAIDERARTTVPGLFACGEAATGMWGAERAGGHAMAAAAVFGHVAGAEAAEHARAGGPPALPALPEEPLSRNGLGEGEIENYERMIRRIVSDKLGVDRRRPEMEMGRGVVHVVRNVLSTKGCAERRLLPRFYRLRFMAESAALAFDDALAHPEDAPGPDAG